MISIKLHNARVHKKKCFNSACKHIHREASNGPFSLRYQIQNPPSMVMVRCTGSVQLPRGFEMEPIDYTTCSTTFASSTKLLKSRIAHGPDASATPRRNTRWGWIGTVSCDYHASRSTMVVCLSTLYLSTKYGIKQRMYFSEIFTFFKSQIQSVHFFNNQNVKFSRQLWSNARSKSSMYVHCTVATWYRYEDIFK